MSILRALQHNSERDSLILLSSVADRLVPNPGVGTSLIETKLEQRKVDEIISEIRERLHIRPNDNSSRAQREIYEFLSNEISRIALGSADERNIRDRLANKQGLRPSQYQIVFDDSFLINEALGIRKRNVLEAVSYPDDETQIPAKTHSKVAVTISSKGVLLNQPKNAFTLLVVSVNKGSIRKPLATFRVYREEVGSQTNTPMDLLDVFVSRYGLRFELGGSQSRLMVNEIIARDDSRPLIHPVYQEKDDIKLIEGLGGTLYLPVVVHAGTRFESAQRENINEVILAFVVDISKYAVTLRKHHTRLAPESEWHFTRL